MAIDREVTWLPFRDLVVDALNPRLPEQLRGAPEIDLLRYIDEHYDALDLATSIARNGFLSSEPLIALRVGNPHVVLEGNRRLTALRGLADAEIRAQFASPQRWADLAAEAHPPAEVPVLLVDERNEAAPIIGYRHIVGIQPWDSFAKARFVGEMVDDPDHGADFSEVAARIGESDRAARALYRNYHIVQQARRLGIPTERLESRFGVFTAAMNRRALREFIGAPAPGDVQRGADPLPDDSRVRLLQLTGWIFGSADQPAVISDSRDLTRLAEVVDSPEGVRELEATGSLDIAFQAAGGPRQQLRSQLARAVAALESAARAMRDADLGEDFDLGDFSDLTNRARAALDELVEALRNLPGAA